RPAHALPAGVPASWKVLATPYFRLAYPPDGRPEPMFDPKYYPASANTGYFLESPTQQYLLDVMASPSHSLPTVAHAEFCRAPPVATPDTQPPQPTTLAGLPMQYRVVYPQRAGVVPWWVLTSGVSHFRWSQGRVQVTLHATRAQGAAALR